MESEHAPAHRRFSRSDYRFSWSSDPVKTKSTVGPHYWAGKSRAWLICEWPFHFGQAVPCETGTRCLVRSMVAGKLVAYQSEVCMAQMSPLPLLYLAFPRRTEEIHLRKDARVASNEPLLLVRGISWRRDVRLVEWVCSHRWFVAGSQPVRMPHHSAEAAGRRDAGCHGLFRIRTDRDRARRPSRRLRSRILQNVTAPSPLESNSALTEKRPSNTVGGEEVSRRPLSIP